MGDEKGPFDPRVGVIACEACGVMVELDEHVQWTRFPVLDGIQRLA